MIGTQIVEASAAYRAFLRAAEEDGVVHAYLIAGDPGMGKRTFARAAAARLLAGHPMDDCQVCRRVREGIHPDLHLLQYDRKMISVAQVRQLTAECSVAALEGAWKCAVIEQADKMTPAAQNALLKFLEEPPRQTVFFLTVPSVRSVLPTIVSRCQAVLLPPAPTEALVRELTDKHGLDGGKAELYARYAGGNMAKAEQLIGRDDYTEIREKVILGTASILDGRPLAAVRKFNECKGQETLFFDALCTWLTDCRSYLTGQRIVNVDQRAALEAQCAKLTAGRVNRMLDACVEAEQRFARYTAFHVLVDGLVMRMTPGKENA